MSGHPMVFFGLLAFVFVVGGAILAVDRWVVQPNRPVVDVEGELETYGFASVPEKERLEEARRLLEDVPGFLEAKSPAVQRMVRRSEPAGTVWAFELILDGELEVSSGEVRRRHSAKVELLQPVIVVERAEVDQGPWLIVPGSHVPKAVRGDLPALTLAVDGLSAAGSDVPGLRSAETLARLKAWPDVLFAGAGDRVVFFWPPPRATWMYWAKRSRGDAAVPSLATSGFEWDLQRAVDIANLIHPTAPELARVVTIDVPPPKIPRRSPNLTKGFKAQQKKLDEELERIRIEGERAREAIRARAAADREAALERLKRSRDR
ncbi:MAG: hypothetical protein AAFU79_29830 [Myxococcota bacterium]